MDGPRAEATPDRDPRRAADDPAPSVAPAPQARAFAQGGRIGAPPPRRYGRGGAAFIDGRYVGEVTEVQWSPASPLGADLPTAYRPSTVERSGSLRIEQVSSRWFALFEWVDRQLRHAVFRRSPILLQAAGYAGGLYALGRALRDRKALR